MNEESENYLHPATIEFETYLQLKAEYEAALHFDSEVAEEDYNSYFLEEK